VSPSPNSPGMIVSSSVMKKPVSTTNITGFLIIYRGSSFFTEPMNACLRISPVSSFLFCFLLILRISSLSPAGQMLGNGAQSQRREEGQRGKDIHHEHKNHCKARRAGLQCAGRLVDIVFLHQGA